MTACALEKMPCVWRPPGHWIFLHSDLADALLKSCIPHRSGESGREARGILVGRWGLAAARRRATGGETTHFVLDIPGDGLYITGVYARSEVISVKEERTRESCLCCRTKED